MLTRSVRRSSDFVQVGFSYVTETDIRGVEIGSINTAAFSAVMSKVPTFTLSDGYLRHFTSRLIMSQVRVVMPLPKACSRTLMN
ncbi:MAG: hypothetical protein J2P41_14645, partial [Blastocatellia bacterium]|nr:hypothetical protein [Blastocatellia bacterium]